MDTELRLFWTGGWDSTFRLLQLSQDEGLTIRPMYIRDRVRKGMGSELAAMRDILPEVRAIARARVLDVDLYDRHTILRLFPDAEISAAYARLAREFRLGYQYELFALLCKGLDVRAECAVENAVRSKAKSVVDAQCRLVPLEEGQRGDAMRFRAVAKGGNTDGELVLGRLDLGMLSVSKAEAQRVAQEMGWMPIMERTWFCHMPIKGEPCGLCNPCADAMNEGMAWRMPPAARLRYRTRGLRRAMGRMRALVRAPMRARRGS